MDILFIFHLHENQAAVWSSLLCFRPSHQAEMFKAIKHFLSCRHALLSQMCMWEHFPDRLHVEPALKFLFFQLLDGRACFHPSHFRMLCQYPALFFQLPSYGESGFCRFVSRQLRLLRCWEVSGISLKLWHIKKKSVFLSFLFISCSCHHLRVSQPCYGCAGPAASSWTPSCMEVIQHALHGRAGLHASVCKAGEEPWKEGERMRLQHHIDEPVIWICVWVFVKKAKFDFYTLKCLN